LSAGSFSSSADRAGRAPGRRAGRNSGPETAASRSARACAPGQKGLDELSKALPKKSEAELRGLLFEFVVLGRDCFDLLGKGEGDLVVAAKALGVNVAAAKSAFEAAATPQAKAPVGTVQRAARSPAVASRASA